MHSKKKWLSRRRNVEDIRKFISVEGKVLKHQQTKEGRKHLADKKATNQTFLYNFISSEEKRSEHDKLVSATTVSKGLRKKVRCKQNKTEHNVSSGKDDHNIADLDLPSIPIPDDSQCTSLLRLTPYSSVAADTIPISCDNNNENICSNDKVATTCTSQFKHLKDSGDMDELADSFIVPNDLSVTTILNILNCDTEEFINQLQ